MQSAGIGPEVTFDSIASHHPLDWGIVTTAGFDNVFSSC